jgi:ligand-binding sensor domain-containing protein/anti-sigma regulatory factor (Ser/Thr protein kinase)
MNLRPKALHLLLILLVSGELNYTPALDPAKALSQYSYTTWQTKEGLPFNFVRSITQTKDGYIWLASESGLIRFDGVRFTLFDQTNTRELGSSGVKHLTTSRDGTLWMGVERGNVLHFNDAFQKYRLREEPFQKDTEVVMEDEKGDIWVGTPGGGVAVIEKKSGRIRVYTTGDGVADQTVLSLAQQRSGTIWIGTRMGLNTFSNGRFSVYTKENGLTDNTITALAVDRQDRVWIGTASGGLNIFHDGLFRSIESTGSTRINTIFEDRMGNIWFGTENGGLSRLRNGLVESTNSSDLLPDNNVQAIYEDSESNLWVGTRRGGLVRITNGKFQTLSILEGLSDDYVTTVYKDRDSSLWVGTRNGLNHIKEGRTRKFSTRDGLPSNWIRTINGSTDGTIWIGTAANGLTAFRNNRFETFGSSQLSNVTSVAEDCDQVLWVADSGLHLSKFVNGKFLPVREADGIAQNGIRQILPDSKCNLWLSSLDGLFRYKDGRFFAYTESTGLTHNSVRSMVETVDGTIWVGTHSGGLNRIKDGKIYSYTRAEGLFTNNIYDIQEDQSGHIWIGAREGIYRIKKSDFDLMDQGKIKKLVFTSYDTTDGMRNSECTLNGHFYNRSESKDQIIFSTTNGVVIVDPARIIINNVPPPVRIEHVYIDKVERQGKGHLQIPPGRGDLEVHFSAMSYTAPEKVRFKYMLEGFDPEWVDAGKRRLANYANLPPGRYTFKVIASNNDGIWNNQGASISFYLKPHFYQTNWFLVCAILLVVLIGLLVHLYRLRQMNLQHTAVLEERNRIAREVHDTLIQGMVGISTQLEAISVMLFNSPLMAKQNLDRLRMLVRKSLEEARLSVWNIRHQDSSDGSLASALLTFSSEASQGSEVEVQLQVQGNNQNLPEKIEKNILRIGQEAIANAIKHSRAKLVLVELSFKHPYVCLCVQDNGCGFDSTKGNGNGHFGLVGMKERADQIGGQLSIHSSPGRGTEIVLVVSLD